MFERISLPINLTTHTCMYFAPIQCSMGNIDKSQDDANTRYVGSFQMQPRIKVVCSKLDVPVSGEQTCSRSVLGPKIYCHISNIDQKGVTFTSWTLLLSFLYVATSPIHTHKRRTNGTQQELGVKMVAYAADSGVVASLKW